MLTTDVYKNTVTSAKGACSLLGTTTHFYLYVVAGLLIDTGPKKRAKDVESFLLSQRISQAALTHLHEDHSGNARLVREKLNIPVRVRPETVAEAREGSKYPLYRHLMWGGRPAFAPDVLPERLETEKFAFDVIDTPGHVPYHSVLFEKNEGWLFSGDMYLGEKKLISTRESNHSQLISSIEVLLSLDFETLFCAHAGIIPNGSEALKRKYDFLCELRGKINTLRMEGRDNNEINRILYPKKQTAERISQGDWATYYIVSTL